MPGSFRLRQYHLIQLRYRLLSSGLALLLTTISLQVPVRFHNQLSAQDSLNQPDDPACDVVELIELSSKHEVWNPPRTLQLLGEIKRFESEQLDLIDRDGSERTVPSKYVMRVVPRWRTTEASRAHQLFVDGKFEELLKAVPIALESNLVQWQQQILIAELVQAVESQGKPRAAGAYFLTLAESKPPPMLFACMPLCWTTREPDQVLRDGASKWLEKKDDDAARLLGASWLLFTDEQAAAQQALMQLQSSSNATIAQLAVAQGWRRVPPPQTMTDLNRWFEFRDKLLPPLQLGPTEFMADRLQRIGKIELAIGEWSRIGSQYSDQPMRSQQALGDATAQLRRLGRDEEAQRFETWMKELQKQPQ
ncbi:MAG: hypothetical protein ABI557_06085 [Aureliella sp.]